MPDVIGQASKNPGACYQITQENVSAFGHHVFAKSAKLCALPLANRAHRDARREGCICRDEEVRHKVFARVNPILIKRGDA
jgi:hypothetical protein